MSEKSGVVASRRTREALRRGRRRGSLGLLRPNPKRRHFGLVFNFFLNQNNIVLGFLVFFFFNQKTPKRSS